MMGWYHGGTGWGGWILMAVAMVAFWVLVVLAIIAIFRDTQPSTGSTAGSAPGSTADRHDPMQILDARFARGEIDEAEYRARASVLRASVR